MGISFLNDKTLDARHWTLVLGAPPQKNKDGKFYKKAFLLLKPLTFDI